MAWTYLYVFRVPKLNSNFFTIKKSLIVSPISLKLRPCPFPLIDQNFPGKLDFFTNQAQGTYTHPWIFFNQCVRIFVRVYKRLFFGTPLEFMIIIKLVQHLIQVNSNNIDKWIIKSLIKII